MTEYQSWGGYPRARHQGVIPLHWAGDLPPLVDPRGPVLPYGLGRSYGDCCLNEGGLLLDSRSLDRFLAFDRQTGRLRCEAGVSLAEVLALVVPAGWFLPVTPGTKFVTVAGAIANDVHGKNHHNAGTFGRHVTAFELVRSDGERLLCSPEQNVELFQATIGGLGLTGLITWAEFTLIPIRSSTIDMERIRFRNVDEFFEISAGSAQDYSYTMSWMDGLSKGEQLGRGLFMRGNHAVEAGTLDVRNEPLLSVPVTLPSFVLNPLTMRLFNQLYYRAQVRRSVQRQVHYDPFFYPLDIVAHWNRVYGKRGFMQYQCVVPYERDHRSIREILRRIAHSGQASFLAVLKEFGDLPSPGLLSFPRPGVTLALDFANAGPRTYRLFEELDAMVRAAGGVLYPAKDARMSPADFQAFYPQWREFSRYIDPHFSSSFWRRVTEPVSVAAGEVPA